MEREKVTQMVSPGSWHVVFYDCAEDKCWAEPLVCFALMSDGGIEAMAMIDEGYVACPEKEFNFVGYSPSNEIPTHFDERAKNIARKFAAMREDGL